MQFIDDCNVLYPSDSIDIYMHFRDKNHKALIDGFVIKRIALNKPEMHINARLFKSDEWKVDAITNRFGKDICLSTYCLIDTVECTNKTIFPDYLPVDSLHRLMVACGCH
ncbi:MAG: hypothetical protein IPL46_24235 [Saprospiraceae bacterium]|nr:hypothetical protein [Saprospiraceae bacterium]